MITTWRTKWLDFAKRDPATRASWIQWQYGSQASLLVTNVKQLLELRSRVAAGYRVAIEGWMAGRGAASSRLCVLDHTGHCDIPEPGDGQSLSPGQPVLLEGTSQWSDHQVGLGQLRVTPRGQAVPVQPRPIALAQPLAPGEEW